MLLSAAAPESSVSLSCLSVVREAMPRRTGLLTALRAMDNDVPVCVLSARCSVEDRVAGLEAGARSEARGARRTRHLQDYEGTPPSMARLVGVDLPRDKLDWVGESILSVLTEYEEHRLRDRPLAPA